MSTNPNIIKDMTEKAKSLIGSKYRKIASLFWWMRKNKGENCVSVVRKCYLVGFKKDPDWIIPDEIVSFGKVIFKK